MLKVIVTIAIAFFLCRVPFVLRRWKEESTVAKKHGCAPPPKSCAKWYFSLDFLVAVFRETANGTVMQFFSSVCEQSGHTFETNVLGDRCINTLEPDNVKALLDTQFNDFGLSYRHPNFSPLLGRGIFTQDGPAWKHSRDILRPQFTKRRLDHFDEHNSQVENLTERIKTTAASASDGKVDLQPIFNRYTLDTTTYMLFGKSIDSLLSVEEGDIAARFAEAFRYGQLVVCQRERVGRLWDGPKFRKAIRVVHSYVDGEIRRAIAEKEVQDKAGENALEDDDDVKSSVIAALLRATRDIETIRGQAVNILLAGRDTTACALTWTFYQLVRHPRVMEKLRAEIEEVLGSGTNKRSAKKSDLRHLPYLSIILKEVLRLYPSVPINVRRANHVTTLPRGGGKDGLQPVLVSNGEFVGYSPYVMHRRKDIYGPDALEFKPERWEVPEGEKWCLKGVGYGYLPFNGGPRVCLGQEFALLEASFAIIRILQEFPSIKLPKGVDVKPVGLEKQDLTLVLSSMEGCSVEVGT